MKSAAQLSGRDLILLALLTVIWGLNWPVMKVGVSELGPMTFRSLSMIGGIPVLWLIIRLRGIPLNVPREHWRELALIALTNMAIWYVLAMYGVKLLSSGRAAILGYTMPIWVAVLGLIVFREKPSPQLGVGVLAAGVGIALLLASEFSTIAGRPAGTLFMLGAACAWALGTHIMRRRRQDTHVMVITFWSVMPSLAICGVIALVNERDAWVRLPNAAEWGAVVYNAVLVFGFAQVMWFRLATILPPVASGLSVMLIPAIGLFSGMALLGEQPHWQDYAALLAILVAIGTALLPARAR